MIHGCPMCAPGQACPRCDTATMSRDAGLRVRTDEERATVHCSCGLDALLASLREAGAEHHQNCRKRAWLNDGPCTCGAEATGDPAPPVDMRQRLDSLERGIDALNAAATSPKDGQA